MKSAFRQIPAFAGMTTPELLEAGAGGTFKDGERGFFDSAFIEIGALGANLLQETGDLVRGAGRAFEGFGEGGLEVVEVMGEIEDHDALGCGGGGLEGRFDFFGVVPEIGDHDSGDSPGLVANDAVGEDSTGFDSAAGGGSVLDCFEDGSVGIVTTGNEKVKLVGKSGFFIGGCDERESGVGIGAGVVVAVFLIIAVP